MKLNSWHIIKILNKNEIELYIVDFSQFMVLLHQARACLQWPQMKLIILLLVDAKLLDQNQHAHNCFINFWLKSIGCNCFNTIIIFIPVIPFYNIICNGTCFNFNNKTVVTICEIWTKIKDLFCVISISRFLRNDKFM